MLDPEADLELYKELFILPPRVRATRLKNLAFKGLLLYTENHNSSSCKGENSDKSEKESRKRKVTGRLLESIS